MIRKDHRLFRLGLHQLCANSAKLPIDDLQLPENMNRVGTDLIIIVLTMMFQLIQCTNILRSELLLEFLILHSNRRQLTVGDVES